MQQTCQFNECTVLGNRELNAFRHILVIKLPVKFITATLSKNINVVFDIFVILLYDKI